MFWNNYAYLCSKVGKYPNSVAAEIGVRSSSSVTAWKNGTLPRAKMLNAISEYFSVSVYDLLNTDLESAKKPTPVSESELDTLLTSLLSQLTPDECSKATAFVQGMIAARKA